MSRLTRSMAALNFSSSSRSPTVCSAPASCRRGEMWGKGLVGRAGACAGARRTAPGMQAVQACQLAGGSEKDERCWRLEAAQRRRFHLPGL